MMVSGTGPTGFNMQQYVYWRDSGLLHSGEAKEPAKWDPRVSDMRGFLQNVKALQESAAKLQELFQQMPALPRSSIAATESSAALGLNAGASTLPMHSVAAFATVGSGSFMLNGRQISVDPQTDSLDDIIQRINSSRANVTASYDPRLDLLSIKSTIANRELELDADSSGLLPALNLVAATYSPPTNQRPAQNFLQSDQLQNAIKDFATQFGQFTSSKTSRDSADDIRKHISGLEKTVRDSVNDSLFRVAYNPQQIDTGLGIVFDWKNSKPLQFDRSEFTGAVVTQPRKIADFFHANGSGGSSKGLLARLQPFLHKLETDLRDELGSTGNLVNIRA